MSAKDISGMLERFNATGGRGDVLSISREDATRLHELPLEIYGPIFHALLGWFLTGKETHLDDPRDRAMLAGFKEHQLGNAARRGKFLNDQKEKSDKAVQARINRTHGTPTDNPRDTQVKDKAKAEEKVEESFSSVDGADRDGLTPPVCPSLSVEEAKKILAMYAPPIISHSQMLDPNDNPTPNARKYIATSSDGAAAIIGQKLFPYDFDTENEDIKELLDGGYLDDVKDDLPKGFFKSKGGAFVSSTISVYDEIFNAIKSDENDNPTDKADDFFKRALIDGYLSAVSDQTVTNRPGWIIARLKKVRDAVRAIENPPPLKV